jgi:hypothetical protein
VCVKGFHAQTGKRRRGQTESVRRHTHTQAVNQEAMAGQAGGAKGKADAVNETGTHLEEANMPGAIAHSLRLPTCRCV